MSALMRLITAVAALLLPVSAAQAGEGDILWSRYFGGDYFERATCVTPTDDGGCVVAGWREHEYAGPWNCYVVRVGAEGDTLWEREYGEGDDFFQTAYGICPTGDGGFVVAGYTNEVGLWSDMYAVRTDANGWPLWVVHHGGAWLDNAYAVCPAGDGGFVLAGNSGSYVDGSLCVMKLTGGGGLAWVKAYSGVNTAEAHSVIPTDDGGFVVAGYFQFWSGDHGEDVYVLRLDAAGDTLWTRTFGGTGSDRGMSVCPSGDGGFMVAGYTSSFGAGSWDLYLLKLNAAGDSVWTRTYGSATADQATSVSPTGDGGFVLAGHTYDTSSGYPDMYLVKISAAGDTLWTGRYGAEWDDFADAVCVSGGGILVAGPGMRPEGGFNDMYLVKVAAGSGTTVPSAGPELDASSVKIDIRPNPFRGATTVHFELTVASRVELQVFDAHGRRVDAREWPAFSAGTHEITWDGTGLPSGIYFAQLTTGGMSRVQRIALLR